MPPGGFFSIQIVQNRKRHMTDRQTGRRHTRPPNPTTHTWFAARKSICTI